MSSRIVLTIYTIHPDPKWRGIVVPIYTHQNLIIDASDHEGIASGNRVAIPMEKDIRKAWAKVEDDWINCLEIGLWERRFGWVK